MPTISDVKLYKSTIHKDSLRKAFIFWKSFSDYIDKIIDSLYTSGYYNEFF